MERLFGTNGIRFVPGVDYGLDFIIEISQSIGQYFDKGKVLLGHDGRISGKVISKAVSSGLMSAGIDVSECGLIPTPALQFSVKNSDYVGGIMITASHNPPEYNGIKVMGKDGVEIPRDDERIIESLYHKEKGYMVDWSRVGRLSQENNVIQTYVKGIISKVQRKKIESNKFKIVLDTGNGVQALSSPTLMRELGCEVVSINDTIDGKFPGRGPEPIPELLTALSSSVKESGSDLGVAYDGDGDRSIFCDEKGVVHSGDKIGAVITDYLLSESPGSLIVTPVSTSRLIDIISSDHNSKVMRTRVGSVDVSRTMIENKALFGLEENGGFFYSPHQPVRDGAMTSALLLEALSKTGTSLSSMLSKYPTLYQKKVKLPCPKEKVKDVMSGLEKSEYEIERVDGLKIWIDSDTWILIRPSGTEPLIRVFAESNDAGNLKKFVDYYVAMIESILKK